MPEYNRDEVVRIWIPSDVIPTGTPTITIDKNGVSILTATNMTQGLDGREWYYDHTVAADAVAGAYQIRFTAVIDGVTLYRRGEFDISIYNVDDNNALLSAITGTGAYNATINVQDQVPSDVADAYVTIHNATDDDEPILAYGTTDTSGNVTLNIEGNVYVRVKKASFAFVSTAKSITASGTYYVTGTANVTANPSDPDLCRLFIYPITLDDQSAPSLKIYISSADKLTKVDGQFIKNTGMDFTLNSATDPDSYYFDAVQGATVQIKCDFLGIDHEVEVPALATQDLDGLIS